MKFKKPDYILLFLITILIVLGNLILATISAPFSLIRFNTTYYFLVHQLVFGLIPGLILAIVFLKIPLPFLKKIAPILLLLNLIILTFVFLPQIGFQAGGAKRWVNLGKVVFQPSEFLKLTTILYLATWLKGEKNQDLKRKYFQKKRKKDYSFKKNLLPFLIFLGVLSLIFIFQPDISTLGIIVLISLIMYFRAGTPLWHNIFLILIGIGGLIYLIKIAPYRLSRFIVFLRPETDPLGIGLQVKQALIAIGSGGIFGRGLGMSSQKFGFLPHPMSDSLFAIFAEEMGFLGSFILISLFLIFFWRGLRISKLSADKFCQLAALGISFWIIIQTFINIGSLIGILPLTGIPLPFISYGGSHFTAELAAVGVLLNISKNT